MFIDGQFICSKFGSLPETSELINCLDTSADVSNPNPVLLQELSNTRCMHRNTNYSNHFSGRRTRLYLGNAPTTWPGQSKISSLRSQAGEFHRLRGLTGTTFKSFHIYNYHGIIDPANPRFCDSTSVTKSNRCSKYHLRPWCRYSDAENEIDYVGLESKNCKRTPEPKCNELGNSENCRFIGDICPTAKPFCATPGICTVSSDSR